jgi:hypothetical protein
MRQSYHQLLNINDLWYSENDQNEIEVSVKIPVPAIFRARDRKEFLRNFEPRTYLQVTHPFVSRDPGIEKGEIPESLKCPRKGMGQSSSGATWREERAVLSQKSLTSKKEFV